MVFKSFMGVLSKIRLYNIKKGFAYLKHYGPKEFMIRLKERMEPEEVPYLPWYKKHMAGPEKLAAQKKESAGWGIKISVAVPAYKTKDEFLRAMMDSLLGQSYENWELIIANASPEDGRMAETLSEYEKKDSRIRVYVLPENKGISANTNEAVKLASGGFVGLLDHDDLLAPDALYEAARAIKEYGADVVYTDEDKTDETGEDHFAPNFKPDFNIDLLRSNNYITHFFVFKKELFEAAGGFREEFDGAQDHDLIFRCCEKAERIVHVPRVLYHWRTHQASTADNPLSKQYAYESGRRAIEDNLKRSGYPDASVERLKDFGFFRVKYALADEPKVSVLIPTKDNSAVLKRCLDSIWNKSTYQKYELILIENNSTEDATFAYYEELKKDPRIRIVTYEGGFNFSAINNFGASFAEGELLMFLNNDTEIITPSWIEELASNAMRKEVGAVGCKLYYPDHTIQHAGVVIGIGGCAGHAFLGMDGDRSGYLHRASIQMDVSAVTAAAMMMRRNVFEEAGGFNEDLAVAFNDIDLCLRVREKDYLVVYDPFCEILHYESKTRGAENTDEKAARFSREKEYLRTRFADVFEKGDPCYNPNLTLSKFNYSLRI